MTEQDAAPETAPAPPSASPLNLARYKPEAGIDMSRVPLALIAVVSAGLVAGFFVSYVGQDTKLLLAFPLAIGLLVGFAGMLGVLLAKLRNVALTTLLALLGTGVALGTMHLADFQRLVAYERAALERQSQELDDELWALVAADARASLNELEAMSLFEYLQWMAEQEMTIHSGHADEETGIELSVAGVWTLWGAELVLAFLIAAMLAGARAKRPFDVASHDWLKRRRHSILPVPAASLGDALESGERERIEAALTSKSDAHDEATRLLLHVPRNPQPGSIAVVELHTLKKKTSVGKPYARYALPHEQLVVLEQSVEALKSNES